MSVVGRVVVVGRVADAGTFLTNLAYLIGWGRGLMVLPPSHSYRH